MILSKNHTVFRLSSQITGQAKDFNLWKLTSFSKKKGNRINRFPFILFKKNYFCGCAALAASTFMRSTLKISTEPPGISGG